MAAVLPEFSITISQKRRACVLDPTLALSPYGIPLVRRLGEVMELWVPRELWHILDNTHFYLRQPETLKVYDQSDSGAQAWPNSEAILRALQEWERIRVDNDPASMKLFWIGDGPSESMLPAEFESSVVWRFEALSSSLDNRLKSRSTLASAFRDAVALSVTLPSALILTHLNGAGDSTPAICRALKDWALDCEPVDDDDWLRLERDFLRQQLVWAGLAKLHWSGLRLAVLQLVAPNASVSDDLDDNIGPYPGELSDAGEIGYTSSDADYWDGARGFCFTL
jgi:hypothetical protein